MPTIDQMYLHRILILSSALVVSLVGSASSFGLKSVTRAHAQERKAVIGHRKSALHADSTSGHDAARGTEGETKTLYGKYLDLLDAKPLETTSISAGVVSALGDILAQWVEARMAKTPFTMNWSRFLAFFISGTFFVGPYLHTWYGKVVFPSGKWVAEKWANASKNIQTLVSLLVDQTIGVAIFFPLYFYVYEYSEALTAWRGKAWWLLPAFCCRPFLTPSPFFQLRIWQPRIQSASKRLAVCI